MPAIGGSLPARLVKGVTASSPLGTEMLNAGKRLPQIQANFDPVSRSGSGA